MADDNGVVPGTVTGPVGFAGEDNIYANYRGTFGLNNDVFKTADNIVIGMKLRLPSLAKGAQFLLRYNHQETARFELLNITVNTLFESVLEPFNTPITAASFPHSPIGVAVYLIYLSILPAVFEEWLFRGILQKNLATVISRRSAIAVSALIFGFMHVDPGQTVFAIGFGLFAGYAFDQTGSIWFGVLIHMVNNAVSGCVSYWTYVYESEEAAMAFSIYMLAFMAIAIFGGVAYIATAGKQKRIRAGEAERMLPKGKAVLVALLKSPMLYIMLVSYGLLLWVTYFL
jgi:membrane protease YdiL (CAAX protease family)